VVHGIAVGLYHARVGQDLIDDSDRRSPSHSARSPTRRRWPLLAVGLAGVLAGAVGMIAVRSFRARSAAGPSAPTDLEAWVPSGARGALFADVAALRRGGLLRAWFGDANAQTPCEQVLARQLERAVVVFPARGLDSMALVLTGPLARADVLACVRQRIPSDARVESYTYDGFDIARVAHSTTPDPIARPDDPELAFVREGLLVAGTSDAVRRLLDLARAGGRTNAAAPSVLQLARQAGARATAVAAVDLAGLSAPDIDGASSIRAVLARVRAVSGSLTATATGVDIAVAIQCSDYDTPRAVLTVLSELRDSLSNAPGTSLRALQGLFANLRVDRGASDVRLALHLSTSDLDALTTLGMLLLRSPGDEPARPPPSAIPGDASRPD